MFSILHLSVLQKSGDVGGLLTTLSCWGASRECCGDTRGTRLCGVKQK